MSKLEWITIVNSLTFAGAAALSSISISPKAFMVLSTLMMIDFVLGLGKSYRMCVPITSYRMKLGIIAKVGMLLIVLSFGLTFTHSGLQIDNLQSYVGWVLWVFILSELYSIISNTYAMKVGEELPEFEVLSIIGGRIRSLLIRLAPTQNKKEDDENNTN